MLSIQAKLQFFSVLIRVKHFTKRQILKTIVQIKAFADDKIRKLKAEFLCGLVENNVGKGENAG